jgi:hypothetical protein
MRSFAPYGIATPMVAQRLVNPGTLPLEAALMRGWEAVNCDGLDSPIFAITRKILEWDSPKGQQLLPLGYWHGFLSPELVARISSSIHWAATPVGRKEYEELRKLGPMNRWKLLRFVRQSQIMKLVNIAQHQCSADCLRPRFMLVGRQLQEERRPPRCEAQLPTTRQSRRIFYCTVRWLLSDEGVRFYDQCVELCEKEEELRHLFRDRRRRCDAFRSGAWRKRPVRLLCA